ncbi:MAG: cytidylate kinase-like family protein [Acidimicrobiales bacterium]
MGGRYDEATYKEHVSSVLWREAERGAVILGRGAAIVLAKHPRALHVRLDGPLEARIAQAMDLGGIDERNARRDQRQTDIARHRYIHRLYHADVADHRLYHLWIDATALPLASCVDLIVSAARARDEFRQLGRDHDSV